MCGVGRSGVKPSLKEWTKLTRETFSCLLQMCSCKGGCKCYNNNNYKKALITEALHLKGPLVARTCWMALAFKPPPLRSFYLQVVLSNDQLLSVKSELLPFSCENCSTSIKCTVLESTLRFWRANQASWIMLSGPLNCPLQLITCHRALTK